EGAAQAEQNEDGQFEFQGAGDDLRTDDDPDDEKGHEQRKHSLRDGQSQETQTSPQQENGRDGDATLFEGKKDAADFRSLFGQPEREPQGIEQPGGGPDREIFALGETVEIIKKPDQYPDAQKRNHQG